MSKPVSKAVNVYPSSAAKAVPTIEDSRKRVSVAPAPTIPEPSVVSSAAAGSPANSHGPEHAQPPEIFFRVLARPVVFVLIALGVHLFLRGHNAPGGGFIAGLVIAVASLLLRMAVSRPLLSFAPKALIPWGLLLAFLTGVVPMALGEPFLTSAFGYLEWPFIGEFEWATAVFFDTGVFLVVIGATLTIIDLLADMGEMGTSRASRVSSSQEPSDQGSSNQVSSNRGEG